MRFPATGRAVWFSEARQADVWEEPVEAPLGHEVTIRTSRSLISRGSELAYYRGTVPPGLDIGLATTKVRGAGPFPIKFGYSCVGVVVAAGSAAEFEIGERVFARHPHQGLFTVATTHNGSPLVVRIPDNVADEAATFTNLAVVALNALLDAPVMLGDVVAVFGQGILGILISLLAQLTADEVVAIEPVEQRRHLARRAGVQTTVAPDESAEVLHSASNGRSADLVVEASGHPAALQQALSSVGDGGTLLLVGAYGGGEVGLTLTPAIPDSRMRIVTSAVKAINPQLRDRWDSERRVETALRLLPRLDPARMITHRFAFDDSPRAFQLIDTAPEQALAVILTYD